MGTKVDREVLYSLAFNCVISIIVIAGSISHAVRVTQRYKRGRRSKKLFSGDGRDVCVQLTNSKQQPWCYELPERSVRCIHLAYIIIDVRTLRHKESVTKATSLVF